MMATPLRALLFLTGGLGGAAIVGYFAGVFEPGLPGVASDVASLPGPANPQPKDERVGEQPAVAAVPSAPADGAGATGPVPAAPGAEVPLPPGAEAAAESTAPEAPAAPQQPPPAAAGQDIASLPAAEQPASAEPAPAAPAATATPPSAAAPAATPPADAGTDAAGVPVPPEGEAGPAQAAASVPSFDLLRVEGDGSVVIAGRAAPNARVDVLVGETVIGAATAGPGGDFAAVLDTPLKPGDYQIQLRATAPGGGPQLSAQTATVSVPQGAAGQVLALVEEPGKPSAIITLPEPKSADAAGGTLSGGVDSSEPSKPGDVAGANPAATPADETGAGTQIASAPAEPGAGADPAPAGEQPVVTAPIPADAPQVALEAVEIEGRNVFVAGVAEPGSTVRVYADAWMLGEAKTSPNGRFLVEADRDLPVGDYVIRADMLTPDGRNVVARAAVPFEREPGESIAAIASPPEEIARAPAPGGSDQTAAAQPDQAAANADQQATAPATPTAPAAAPSGEQPAAPADATLPKAGATADGAVSAQPPAGAAQPTDQAELPGTGAAGGTEGVTAAAGSETPAAAAGAGSSTTAQTTQPAAEANPAADAPVTAEMGQAPAGATTSGATADGAPAVPPTGGATTSGATADAAPPTAGGTAASSTTGQATASAPAGSAPATDAQATPPMTADAQPPVTPSNSIEEAGSAATAEAPAGGGTNAPAVAGATPRAAGPASAAPAIASDGSPAPAAAPEQQAAAELPAAAATAPADATGADGTAASKSGTDVAAAAAAPQPAAPKGVATVSIPETVAPKLRRVSSAVIIRRGDSLWRISRRVYGRGVRYSTIYLANQQQIEDPDRIWPGQVFKVPSKTQAGESADLTTVKDRTIITLE